MAVKIGSYIIHHASEGKIWIGRTDGEGGQFAVGELEEALDKFWAERF